MYILVAMWRLLCQSTEFLFFSLSDSHKSSWSSQICSGYLNHCQRTVWVLMKALPSQGQSCWVSVAECKVIPLYCHEVSQTTSAPADQSPARMSPAHGCADCWGPDTPANTLACLFLCKNSSLNYSQGGMMSRIRHHGVLLVFGTTLCRAGWKPGLADVTWDWDWMQNLGGVEIDFRPPR